MSGVCLQQDVLYDLLDCYEHLELYAYLKNVPRNQINAKVKKYSQKKFFSQFFLSFYQKDFRNFEQSWFD